MSSFQNLDHLERESSLWKFKNSLVSNEEHVLKVKEIVNKIQGELNHSNQFYNQGKWEMLKYEIFCSKIKFSKDLAKAWTIFPWKPATILRDQAKLWYRLTRIYLL